MTVVSVRLRSGGVSGLAAAVLLTATLVVTPPGELARSGPTRQIHAVQLQAVTVSALLNDAGDQASKDAGSATLAQAGPHSNTTAAASGSPNLFAVAAAIGLGALLLPAWYLTFPVTLPLTILFIGAFGGVCSGCFSGSSQGMSNPLANIILPGVQWWLTGPIQGVFNLLSPRSASAVTSEPRSVAAAGAAAVQRNALSGKGVQRSKIAMSARAGTHVRSASAQTLVTRGSQDRAGNTTGKGAAHSKR